MQLLYGIIFAMLVLCVGLVFKILPTSPFLAYLGVAAQNFCQNFSKLLTKLFGKYFRYL